MRFAPRPDFGLTRPDSPCPFDRARHGCRSVQRNIYDQPVVYTRIVALSIKDPNADRLARELAARTGETLTEAIVTSLRERLEREKKKPRRRSLADELGEIGRRCASLPVVDARTPDQILGYDKRGLPR